MNNVSTHSFKVQKEDHVGLDVITEYYRNGFERYPLDVVSGAEKWKFLAVVVI